MEITEHTIGNNKLFVEHLIPDEFEDSSDDDNEIFETPIVFIHGVFSGHFIWQRMSSFFAEAGFECYSLSLRGHSSSGGSLEGATLKDYVQDIRDVVDELHIQKPILIGHSLGGLLSLLYAHTFEDEVKAVIGLDPAPTKEAWRIPVEDEVIESFGDIITAAELGAPQNYAQAIDAMPDISPEYLLEIDNRSGKESGVAWKEVLGGVSIPEESFGDLPMLFMGVEYDDVLPYSIPAEKVQKMAELYNADFLAAKGTTHVGIVIGKYYRDIGESIVRWLTEMVGDETQ